MRILLDPQIFNDQKYGGISRYYTEIFSRLKANNEVEVELPIITADNEYLKRSDLFSSSNKKFLFVLRFLNSLGISIRKKIRKKNLIKAQKALKNKQFDLFIPTYYNPYFLDFIDDKPYVLTVYDMIHELYSDYFSDGETIRKNKLLLMENATKIIAVSQNTKKDITTIYPHIDSSKIEVIYHGSSIKIDPLVHLNLPSKYLLFVGVREGYKNFKFFIESISDVLKNDSDLFVVCAGGGNFNQDEKQFLEKLGVAHKVKFEFFQENQLGFFYQNAVCFVFPSMYEGFGIPVLESMASGCPVVLTNNSSFPEVAGDAGIFFKLNDAIDLKNKISSLLEDDELRRKHIAKGFEQIKRYDWDRATEECLQLYKNVIE